MIPKKEEDYGHLSIEISAMCNLDCYICSLKNQYKNKGLMSLETFNNTLEAIKKVKHMDLGFNGETLLNKNFIYLIKSIKKTNPSIHIHIITNATLLNKKIAYALVQNKIGHIIVSIDANTEKTYRLMRGSNLMTIIKNIQKLNQIKKKYSSQFPKIFTIYTTTKDNLNELPSFIDLAKKLQISRISINNVEPYTKNISLKAPYQKNLRNYAQKIIEIAKNNAIEDGIKFENARLYPKTPLNCRYINPVILWNGDVTPCAALSYERKYYFFNKKRAYKRIVFGNINKERFKDIWYKKEYKLFREKVAKGNFPNECRYCMRKYGIICP